MCGADNGAYTREVFLCFLFNNYLWDLVINDGGINVNAKAAFGRNIDESVDAYNNDLNVDLWHSLYYLEPSQV